jgi:HemY protein
MLRAVDWALQDQDWTLAQRRLDALPQGVARRIQAMRFKLKLARGQGNTTRALDVMRALAKHHAFSPAAASSLYNALAADALREAADVSTLKSLWASLDTTRQAVLEVQCAWVQRRWALCRDDDERDALAHELFAKLQTWHQRLDDMGGQQRRLWVDALEPLLKHVNKAGVQWVQTLLEEHGGDVWVQYLAATTWAQQGLWGKAQTATDGLVKQRQLPPPLVARVWRLQAMLADERGDQAAAQAAWRQAAEAACAPA